MTTARKKLISIADTPYYHVVSRCVRRAFLAGFDRFTNTSFEHRRQWIVDRMMGLVEIFSIDICAYAVMSNHYHIVLKVTDNRNWSMKQVFESWEKLYQLPYLAEKYLSNEINTPSELKQVRKIAKRYRNRLMSISWYMKCLNQYIAVKANAEDRCKGHFWESRFKSQALLDSKALLTCMAYVDLNPIRAAISKTLENSDYTSIQARIKKKNTSLMAFSQDQIPYYLSDYVALVDATGRAIHTEKRGYINNELPEILTRLNINPDTWLDELKQYKTDGFTAVGSVSQLRVFCKNVKKKWCAGLVQTPILQ
jgi:REP element-mobilizing transposase RayT